MKQQRNHQNTRRQQILNTIPIFLAKTYRIVDNPEYSEIVGWTLDQMSFVVKDISRLTTEIFPKHFKHSNFLSFIRQLNMYCFKKIRKDEEQGHVFYHQFFQKNNIEFLLQIKKRQMPVVINEENVENIGAVVAVNSRQQKLEKELQQLKDQHFQLQNMMQLLMQQNQNITAQNKMFATMMAQMKEKYRKKLETLMLLFLFGKKPKTQDGEFLFPPQFQNMIEAFEQIKNGSNSLILAPQSKKKKSNMKMLTEEPHFFSDVEKSQYGSVIDQQDKEDLMKQVLSLHEKKPKKIRKRSSNAKLLASDDDENNDIPVSPISSIVSRCNIANNNGTQWDQYLQQMSHQDFSQLELQQEK